MYNLVEVDKEFANKGFAAAVQLEDDYDLFSLDEAEIREIINLGRKHGAVVDWGTEELILIESPDLIQKVFTITPDLICEIQEAF